MTARKGDWVQIHNIILKPEERAPQIPDDTKKVPLEMWIKGTILYAAKIGEQVEIETVTGRRVKGTLVEVNPSYTHSFGSFVPEIIEVDKVLKEMLFGGDVNDNR